MEDYQISGLRSSGNQPSDKQPSPALPGGAEPLVNNHISHHTRNRKNPVKALHVWPRALKLERDFKPDGKTLTRGDRAAISSFTMGSKRRLKFTASNAFPMLISQFGMTYHQLTPDGREVKKHVDRFLTLLRRHFPGCGYLWIMEFQFRGVPHYHLFLTLPHDTPGLHKFMAYEWHRIAEPESDDHLWWHQREKNFIPWDMGAGSYLCKYLDKEHQKQIPEGYTGSGRFWGNSRGLVPEAICVQTADIDNAYSWETVDQETGEVETFKASEYVTRQLCKHHEKSLRRSPWKSSARKRLTSYTLPNGYAVYRQLENYLSRQPRPLSEVPF